VEEAIVISVLVAATVYALDCFAVNEFTSQAGLLLDSSLGIFNACKGEPKKPCTCKPCIPPVGTLGYRVDSLPTKPHFDKDSGIWLTGDHWHLYEMNQSPSPVCKCFWNGLGDAGPYPPPPAGAVRIGPAGGGGCQER
jgi:hypothetical protein